MAMKSFLVLSLVAALAVVASRAQELYPNRVPDLISVCYKKEFSDRYVRMPQSIDNLIALIRKIEAHEDTALWSLSKMTATLLRRFRYDGIIDSEVTSEGLLPINRDQVETSKYSLQWDLYSGSASDFPEDALTQKEKCSLHWMLSYSVNRTQRAEEVPRVYIPNVRSMPVMDSSEGAEAEEASTDVERHHVDHHVVPELRQAVPETDMAAESSEESVENEEDQDESLQQANEASTEKSITSDSQEDDDAMWRRRRRQVDLAAAELPKSARPLELGIVHTSAGNVAPGIVLAGIVTGRDPQTAKLKNLIKDMTLQIPESAMARDVESPWVATLAGDLAQTALLKTSANEASVGPRAHWNRTYCPREAALESAEVSMMTNAEMYGGIDGLLMARHVQIWDNSYMKLSHLLEMYYSPEGVYQEQSFRACNRLNLFNDPSIVDHAQLKNQALSAALIYYARGMVGSPQIDPSSDPTAVMDGFVRKAYDEMITYLRNNEEVDEDFERCQGAPRPMDLETPATYTDLTLVLDQFNNPLDIDAQKELAGTLATLLNIKTGGSRMEMVSSKDGKPFFRLTNSTNGAEVACLIDSLDIGYGERNMPDVLNKLRSTIAKEREFDKLNRVTGANSRTVLFVVNSWTQNTAEGDKMMRQIEKMRLEMPDVNVMFATVASPEEFRRFVKDFDRDILRLSTYSNYVDAAPELAQRLAQVPARLQYPMCKENSNTGASGEASFVYNGFLNPNTIQYFRLGAEHFSTSEAITLSFQSTYGVARFCWSQTTNKPGLKDSCSNLLQTNQTHTFRFVQPCGRLPDPTATCADIYVSATPLDSANDGVPCSEPACMSPGQVKFTFTHSGLRCLGSAAGSLMASLSLVMSLLVARLTLNI